MRGAHWEEISNAEFDAIAADLKASLDSLHVKPELRKNCSTLLERRDRRSSE